jgi:hypothetical protein
LLAPALDRLYRVQGEFVDYRELSVRHLGTIYERLLQFRLAASGERLELVPAPGRRESGSYFTPGHVVDRIVERTLEPILDARSRAAAEAGWRDEQTLEAFLQIRVLDPAMGSAHFLVGACAYIAQYIATDPSYGGSLSLEEIQRLVAERCLYGVDINALAVELAQLSVWLTTVREGEPLTFLHDLREGNSLVGADVAALLDGGGDVFAQRLAREVETLLAREAAIASGQTDVHEKEQLARAVEALREPLDHYATDYVASAFTDDVGRPFHWQLDFPEVFLGPDGRPRQGDGFDAVIGNPPWVRIQVLGRQLADYCREHYATASGAFDTYIVFLERSLSLLAPKGRLGFRDSSSPTSSSSSITHDACESCSPTNISSMRSSTSATPRSSRRRQTTRASSFLTAAVARNFLIARFGGTGLPFARPLATSTPRQARGSPSRSSGVNHGSSRPERKPDSCVTPQPAPSASMRLRAASSRVFKPALTGSTLSSRAADAARAGWSTRARPGASSSLSPTCCIRSPAAQTSVATRSDRYASF